MVASGAPEQLIAAVEAARPQADILIDEALNSAPASLGALEALRVVAARPSAGWTAAVEHITSQSGVPASLLQSALVPLAHVWNTDPRLVAQQFAFQTARLSDHVAVKHVDAPGESGPWLIHSSAAPPASPRR